MTGTATGALVPARAPRAKLPGAVLHLVPVLFSDAAAAVPAALCGYRPKRGYPWVLRPKWPTRYCPLCTERGYRLIGRTPDLTGADVSFAVGSLTLSVT